MEEVDSEVPLQIFTFVKGLGQIQGLSLLPFQMSFLLNNQYSVLCVAFITARVLW